MNVKNPKMWAAIIAIVLALVGAFTGMDLKKAVCDGDAAAAEK